MQLIKSVTVDHFRSIQQPQTVSMKDFTAIAGLNNAGKSNLLRALNLFFTGNTDADVSFDYASDYNRHDLKSKKKSKDINVAVRFELPSRFRFRKGLEPVEKLLGRNFTIGKAWSRNSPTPKYLLNDSNVVLDDIGKIDQFLNMINFRYIPNRVFPLDMIRNEHAALRDALVRRLSRRLSKQDEVFMYLKNTSEKLVEGMQKHFQYITGVDNVRLDMPSSWQDFVFALGYKFTSGDIEVDDSAQGSGVQSLLMLQTLALIDKDYFQQFGWKQAAFWAIEEPESSLHTSLEASVASFLSEIATEPKGRLQILGTTHSDLMLQASDTIVMVKMDKGRTRFEEVDKRQGLIESARQGVSRFTHPLLAEPLHPVILVEGKSDHEFLQQAIRLLAPNSNVRVSFLEELDNSDGATGGYKALQTYLKSHKQLLSIRMEGSPTIVLLDWDAKNNVSEFEKYCRDESRYQVFCWPDSSFNSSLNRKFKGLERHMPDRVIEAANLECDVLAKTNGGAWTCSPDDYNKKFKPAVFKIIRQGLSMDDLIHVKSFVKELLKGAARNGANLEL